ncbi:transporter substrate-binding domain-containing protein [Aquipseudomonas ullengensis]|uniref:Transporter substrate-binding domain-containing protein n=1 Tax=Aquipseudomonas ullengensis TaxID=2759166 RepID=A0A7W4LLP5_9GAMM|nr:transporter substrate-binding domain-containing protein [Pseudomonas ullengensis]MBB2495307.1 transporter substrate-binding domain-containing protein [Pseudomonas ullengensis]
MRAWLLTLLLCLGVPSVHAADPLPAQIEIVSEYWAGHTNHDGSGLAWDIMRLVFEPAGVKMVFHSVPYTRSIGLVQRSEADAWLGSYRDEISQGVFYPQWNYDADRITALSLSSKPVPTLENLGQFRLAWMRGYDYQAYLPGISHFQEIERRSGILGMLEHDHADFYIDADSEIEEVLNSSSTAALYRTTQLTRLALYPGFADNARGRALAALFDQRMAELVHSGALRSLFQHWQQPYPFDPDMERSNASP